MTKKTTILLILLSLFLCGCSLAVEDQGSLSSEPKVDDQIAGILITTSIDGEPWNETAIHSFPMEGERLYAKLQAEEYETSDGDTAITHHYRFPENTGYTCMGYLVTAENAQPEDAYWTNTVDPGIRIEKNAYHTVNDNSFVQLEGTIFVADTAKGLALYMNPVYQADNGDVYALGIAPVGYGAVSMYDCSVFYEQEVTESENGNVKEENHGYVKMTIKVISLPEEYVLHQMDDQNQILASVTFTPETLPEKFTPSGNCAYLILEAHSDKAVERWVYSPGDGNYALDAFYPMENSICHSNHTRIDWEGAK